MTPNAFELIVWGLGTIGAFITFGIIDKHIEKRAVKIDDPPTK